jgi:hypothetical protein
MQVGGCDAFYNGPIAEAIGKWKEGRKDGSEGREKGREERKGGVEGG